MEVKTCSIYCGLPKATKKESKKKGINNCGNRRKSKRKLQLAVDKQDCMVFYTRI